MTTRRVQSAAMGPRDALARLRQMAESGELDELCERHGLELMVAFGSATRGDVAQPDDLDVAVRFAGDGDLVALTSDLIRQLHYDAVDVMDLGRAGIVARAEALAVCVPLYERRRGMFAAAQMAAVGQRLDTQWLRRLSLELMAR